MLSQFMAVTMFELLIPGSGREHDRYRHAGGREKQFICVDPSNNAKSQYLKYFNASYETVTAFFNFRINYNWAQTSINKLTLYSYNSNLCYLAALGSEALLCSPPPLEEALSNPL